MKLSKLLGLGKAFWGNDPTVEYRLNKRFCLPKFNDGKNPFTLKTAETTATLVAVNAPAVPVASAAPVPASTPIPVPLSRTVKAVTAAKVAGSSGLTVAQAVVMAKQVQVEKTTPSYAFKPLAQPVAKLAAQPVVQLATQPAAKAKAGWRMHLNPFRPPVPEPPAKAQQTEFPLESVKVLHNDLVDVDVDVVSAKSQAGEPAAPMLPPARQAWEYLGEKLLNVS